MQRSEFMARNALPKTSHLKTRTNQIFNQTKLQTDELDVQHLLKSKNLSSFQSLPPSSRTSRNGSLENIHDNVTYEVNEVC